VSAEITIGYRAYEEVTRLFSKHVDARLALGMKSQQLLYDWMEGVSPSAKYLQRLHYCGADVIYILTGMRKDDRNQDKEKGRNLNVKCGNYRGKSFF
jgi:hypothetical protein